MKLLTDTKPIGIFYEHPEWFEKLFRALDKRGIAYEKIDAAHHLYDPAETESSYSLVFNRTSASAYTRDHAQSIFHTSDYLYHLERLGVPIINGLAAATIEVSKAKQLALFRALGLGTPKSFVLNHISQIPKAAAQLRFPIILKVNIGGRGAGIVKFNTREGLQKTVDSGDIDLGVDHTALMQEFVPARGGHIHRVETLNGKFLYAMKVYTTGESFNLCPAEACQIPDEPQALDEFCVVDAPKNGVRFENFVPSTDIIQAVEKIVKTAKIDVGGIEYMIDDRTGEALFYDINALSNFVADAENIIGFNPYENLVDYLEERLSIVYQNEFVV